MATIVVIESEESIVDLLRLLLADVGYEVLAFGELAAVPEDAAGDVVVADLVPLGGAYKPQVARAWVQRIQRRFPGRPVIVCTAHRDALAEPDRLGAAAVIGKPFDVEEFLASVERAARGGPA
ncbi:MAG: hypothetical protein ACRDF0_05810 [Candidatus Limnocylindria bacterium]